MHLAILTQYYRPETGAPPNRLSDLAKRVQAQGHQVTVLTAMPNYPSGNVESKYRKRFTADEYVDDIRVLRSWIYSHKGRGTAHQLAAYSSFAVSSLLTGPFRLKNVDILLWECPPLFLAPSAEAIARKLRAKLVMNVSDLWPESAIELGMLSNQNLIKFFTGMARRSYLRSDLVIGQTNGILDGIEKVAPGTETMLLANGVDCERFRPGEANHQLAEELGIPLGHKVLAYAGNFGRAQALSQVTEAARQVLKERDDVVVLLIGDGPVKQQVVTEASDLDPKRFLVRPSVDSSRMPDLLSLIDVAIVPLADQSLFEGARPSKMFELMASGVPFVFAGRGEGADLARESGGALVVPPESPTELAEAASLLLSATEPELQAMASEARLWVKERYDRGNLVSQVVDRLIRLAAQPN